MADTSKEAVERLVSSIERHQKRKSHKSKVNPNYAGPDHRYNELCKSTRALLAERDALRKAVDGYAYIGRNGKVTLAKDLEDERDQLRNQLHTAHNAGLDAAINCISEFLSSERIGSHEYVKGQTECMLHLLDKISAMKSDNGGKK